MGFLPDYTSQVFQCVVVLIQWVLPPPQTPASLLSTGTDENNDTFG